MSSINPTPAMYSIPPGSAESNPLSSYYPALPTRRAGNRNNFNKFYEAFGKNIKLAVSRTLRRSALGLTLNITIISTNPQKYKDRWLTIIYTLDDAWKTL